MAIHASISGVSVPNSVFLSPKMLTRSVTRDVD